MLLRFTFFDTLHAIEFVFKTEIELFIQNNSTLSSSQPHPLDKYNKMMQKTLKINQTSICMQCSFYLNKFLANATAQENKIT